MPTAATTTMTPSATITVARRERPGRAASRPGVPVPWLSAAAAVDFGESRFFPERCLARATIYSHPREAHIINYRLYMSLAAESARMHPARSPRASRRLARAMVAADIACARFSARLMEAGVGWRSICAPID